MNLIRKIIVPLIITTIFMSSFNFVMAAENICVLSDFENGLEGWNNDFESTMYRTNEEAHSGNFSMETTVMNDYGCPKFHFRFIPGVKYRFSVWVKVKGAADVAQVIFDYSAYGQQQPWWGFFGMNTPVSQDEWTEIAFDYTYNGGNPTGDTNIFIRIGDGRVHNLAAEERKTYYIDDLKISYQNPGYKYVDTIYSEAETAVNMGFDLNTDGYYMKNAHMKYVKEGCNNTYGAALVITDAPGGYAGQKYIAEEGKRYELSAYIKSPDKKIPFKYMVAENVNGNYISRALSEEIYIGDEWTKITANYQVRGDESSNEKIFYILGGNGSNQIKYYLDEFSVLRYDLEEETEYKENKRFFSNPENRPVLNADNGNIEGSVPSYFKNSEFMCQADVLANSIGAEGYFLPDGSFCLKKGTNTLKVLPYSNVAYFNNIVKAQNNMPEYVNSRLMISADFVAEMFGLETEFIKDCNIFHIKNEELNGNLSNTVKKINKKEKIKIAYFGSSFTRGGDTDYPIVKPVKQRILDWFDERYPYIETELIDAEVNGTDSILGLYRLENDVLAYSPDLVFIDFSVNDFHMNSPKLSAENIENMIRRITEYKRESDIVILNSLSTGMIDTYESGEKPFLTKIYKDTANYYDVAFVDLAQCLYNDYRQSQGDITDYYIKDMQITEKSAQIYMNELSSFLSKSIKNNNNLFQRNLKAALFPQNNKYRIISADSSICQNGWEIKKQSLPDQSNTSVAYSDTKGSCLSVGFDGTSIGIIWQVSPKSGAIEYKVDDGEWKYLDAYDDIAYKYSRLSYVILEQKLKNTNHTLTIRMSDKINSKSMGKEIVIGGFLEKR